MTLAFINPSGAGYLFLLVPIVLIIAIGHYGRETQLGYTGTVLLGIFGTPLLALLVVLFLRSQQKQAKA